MPIQLFRFVPVLRHILSLRFRVAAMPGAKHRLFCKESYTERHLIFSCITLCSLNLIVAVILFVAGPIIIYLRSQKDRSGKKDCRNRKAMNLLYKNRSWFFYPFFWSALPVQLFRFVPVLRYILSLRFRDAATPRAKRSPFCKKSGAKSPVIFFSRSSFIYDHKKIGAERRTAATEKQ